MATEQKGSRIDSVGDWMMGDHSKDGAKYYLGALGTVAGVAVVGLGAQAALVNHDPIAAGIEVAAGLGIVATATDRLGVRERLKEAINSFADQCTAELLAFGTPIISVTLAASDLKIAALTLAAGETAAATSFVASKIKRQ